MLDDGKRPSGVDSDREAIELRATDSEYEGMRSPGETQIRGHSAHQEGNQESVIAPKMGGTTARTDDTVRATHRQGA